MWNRHHSFMARVTISLTFNCDRVNHKNASEISSQIHRRGETWPPPHLGEHPCYCQSKNPVTVKTITFSEPVWKIAARLFCHFKKSLFLMFIYFFSLSSLNSSDFSSAFFSFLFVPFFFLKSPGLGKSSRMTGSSTKDASWTRVKTGAITFIGKLSSDLGSKYEVISIVLMRLVRTQVKMITDYDSKDQVMGNFSPFVFEQFFDDHGRSWKMSI